MFTEPVLTNTREDFGVPAKKQNPLLASLGKPHVDAFNYMLEEGLSAAIKDLPAVHFTIEKPDNSKSLVLMRIVDADIYPPTVPSGTIGVKDPKIYPTECRQRGASYKGKLIIKIGWSIDGQDQGIIEKDLGSIPIMVRSNRCNLNKMTPEQLVKHGEHEHEWGGYFILKGHERIIRMLVMTRRNYPIAVKRSTWKSRGSLFSDLGILIRCVRDDGTAVTNTMHYVTDETAKFTFSYKKNLYYIPVILLLKALIDVDDLFIYQTLLNGREHDSNFRESIRKMLNEIHQENLHRTEDCKNYIGQIFRVRFFELPPETSNAEVCDYIIQKCVAIHLDKPVDKFNLLIFMTKKLFAFAKNECVAEGVDAVMMHECLMGGHLYLQVLNEKLYTWLCSLRSAVLKRARMQAGKFELSTEEIIASLKYTGNVESQMDNFLSTGNVKSQSGLGLMQSTGFSVVAENINRMRYMSHFRALHRGSFFMEMRTTEARRLLPDAWGFVCPVHTPDGAPCGLLNHLTMNCIVTQHPDKKKVDGLLKELKLMGMEVLDTTVNLKGPYTVLIDGKVVGLISEKIVTKVVDNLRLLKIDGVKVPKTTEIALVPKTKVRGQHPGVFIFTGPSRMMRPVMNLAAGKVELIGTFEQVYLNICITPEEADKDFTHQELAKTTFLSNLAQLIPMPDCNQSPRNIYQCQMGKQSMATPTHTWHLQSETKLYRLQTPNTPLFRPAYYDKIDLDHFPMGLNAIVAVISYTGYDMEDAMIMNKSAVERGFAHGCIYKSEFVDLKDSKSYFLRNPNKPELAQKLDVDGLPYINAPMTFGDPMWCMYIAETQSYVVGKYKSKEDGHVDNVRLCNTLQSSMPKRVCITIRVPRNPTIGDKFASRAGQKGICSKIWPTEDLPFTETGLVPDIIFNPHGFPSRMTIAMMIEVMAGKSAAVHGLVHDATPFRFNEEDTAVDYFGKLLQLGGYNYYGTEKMYSGIDGREMKAEIFFGTVYYQRLRHMVLDKWQVRSTGPIDILTRQPIKGRRRGGGVRFGEMERDALISHGCAYLLQDRLFHCSDKVTSMVCNKCGSLLGPITEFIRTNSASTTRKYCRICKTDDTIGEIDIPYIFRYLVTQLASCNINLRLDLTKV